MKPSLLFAAFLAFQSCATMPSDTSNEKGSAMTPRSASETREPTSDDGEVFALVDSFNYSPEEWKDLIKSAEAGSPEAALRVAEHYNLAKNNDREAHKWYRLAVQNGGVREAEIYRSFRETR